MVICSKCGWARRALVKDCPNCKGEEMPAEARHYEQTFRWAANYLLRNGYGASDLFVLVEKERQNVTEATARKLYGKEKE